VVPLSFVDILNNVARSGPLNRAQRRDLVTTQGAKL